MRAIALGVSALVVGALPLTITSAAYADQSEIGNLRYNYTPGGGVATVSGIFGMTSGAVTIPIDVTIGGMPYMVTSISQQAFYQMGVTSVSIPDTVISIGTSAFESASLTSVSIPDSVTTIGDGAFYNNSLTSATLSSSLTLIPPLAFGDNSLTSIAIPSSVTTIGGYAFDKNDLTAVTLPQNLTSIGQRAFSHNALTSVIIPAQVNLIGDGAFADNSLTSVTFAGDAPSFIGTAGVGNPLGSGVGLTVHYTCGAAGFTTPQWHGYNTSTSCAVTFNPNGGSGFMAQQYSGVPAALAANTFAPPAGQHFAGWNTSADGSGTAYAASAVFPFSANTTLYAQWAANPVATIAIHGPASVDELTTQSYTVESFDEFGASLGDVSGQASLSGPQLTATGTDVTFAFDPTQLGQTKVRTLTATLDSDPSITASLDVSVASAAKSIRILLPGAITAGDTAVFGAEALDASGSPLGVVTDRVVFSSSLAGDAVAANRITFPTPGARTVAAAVPDAQALTATAAVDVAALPAANAPIALTGADPAPWGPAAALLLVMGGVLAVARGLAHRRGV